jgi:hypothetical protein
MVTHGAFNALEVLQLVIWGIFEQDGSSGFNMSLKGLGFFRSHDEQRLQPLYSPRSSKICC